MLEALGLRLPPSFATPLLNMQRSTAALGFLMDRQQPEQCWRPRCNGTARKAKGWMQREAETCRRNVCPAFDTCKAKT